MASLKDIRAGFLNYFEKNGHNVMPSSSLVPGNDPTLMFTNAGMVQFKNIFTGAEERPAPRAATSQKCVRAGGKHNDLDNVGYTARHHTFFEMLGNFSFGDYFKEDAIRFAWELITKDYGLPKDRLLVTVYSEDEDAADLWKKAAGLSDSKIIRIPTNDNFWRMGDTGPCGPCSEIFFDHGDKIFGGPPGSADQDGDRFVEIWNLVFMQFEERADGTRANLPKPSIDTGMGLERVAAVLQGVTSNYDTDLFKALIAASVELTKVKAEGPQAASHRVISDHLRASSFLIADGVQPASDGRGYVLRRIMRRAMRHAHILGAREPLMHRLVPSLVQQMGEAYPELVRAEAHIRSTLLDEEERFQRTLGRGLEILEEASSGLKSGQKLDGAVAFKLYDTYGFPLDLTQDILRARDIAVDTDGFDANMEAQRDRARAHWAGSGETATDTVWLGLKDKLGGTDFLGYGADEGEGKLIAIIANGAEQKELKAGDSAELLFDKTPFYAESGGQAGDHGRIRFKGAEFEVADTQKRAGALHAHVGKLLSGSIKLGDGAKLAIDATRRNQVRANHSATHLLHAALRRNLGPHVTQKGSQVEADRFRFDFSHNAAISRDALDKIEAEVNAVIRQNEEAQTKLMKPQEAIEAGAMALFGEKYGDEVRVLTLGHALEEGGFSDKPYSVELCGGTHVRRTGDIALFTILSESAVAAGVRRIEGTTGATALEHLKAQAALGRQAAEELKTTLQDLPKRAAALSEERRKLDRELADTKKKLALAGPATGGAAAGGKEEIAGIKFSGRVLQGVAAKDLRGMVDEAKKALGSGVVAYIGVADGKAALTIGVTADLAGKISAVDLVRAGAAVVGGQGGGGRPDMAQAGGPDGAKADEALAAIREALKAKG